VYAVLENVTKLLDMRAQATERLATLRKTLDGTMSTNVPRLAVASFGIDVAVGFALSAAGTLPIVDIDTVELADE
jgi:hypothetical protein